MKKSFLILSILMLWACESTTDINMEDLNFSDFNRQMILKNGIKKTYMIAKLDSFLDKKNDTLGVIEYDNRGNITRRA
tara:strand:- start:1490 stop:1723 length:234 start_codon:yes stop_codon:yes gene_type:complete